MLPDTAEPLEGVAIIGMAGRFPGARTIAEFWRNLLAGVDSISRFAPAELEPDAFERQELRGDPSYVRARGVLDDVDRFDAAFFGIYPAEAELLDPQQRLFLEAAWEALEEAGYDPERYPGAIGVFAGMSNNTYGAANLGLPCAGDPANALQTMMANEKDYLATRVSYKLNLRGPALNIQTACSTSLVAVAQAVQSLLGYHCDMALAGGVSVTLPQKRGYLQYDGAITSPDGYCRPFDVDSAGTVFGNGLGIVVLKRLSEAIADGDHIYAVIKGAALNNDGSGKVSFLAPSVGGHADAVRIAQEFAGVDPRSVSFIEAHGTATALGDAVEIAALTQAFRQRTAETGFCVLGSVKANIGHLDAAAGVAGLIKATLALHHGAIPPTPHFTAPNPKLGLEQSPFFVNSSIVPWSAGGAPRRAGVSSLGVGGTNAHVVLEEAPQLRRTATASGELQVLPISARTAAALDEAAGNLCRYLESHPDADLADVAFTLQNGRRPFAHRRALVCRARQDAIRGLRDKDGRSVLAGVAGAEEPAVAFVASGQRVSPGAGRELYESTPAFRAAIDRCAPVARERLGVDLVALLCSLDGGDRIETPALVDVVSFAFEYALSEMWTDWGVHPRMFAAAGTGEYVAAAAAGVVTCEEALALVIARAACRAGSNQSAALATFQDLLAATRRRSPAIPWCSALTGAWVTMEAIAGDEYWIRHASERALSSPGELLQRIAEIPDAVVLHIDSTVARAARIETAGRLWVRGVAIEWQRLNPPAGRLRVSLPTYPFERTRHWVTPAVTASPANVAPSAATFTADSGRAEVAVSADEHLKSIRERLTHVFSECSGIAPEQLDPRTTFLELGLDSLFLTQAATAVHKAFGVKVTFRELVEELTTMDAVADHVARLVPPRRERPADGAAPRVDRPLAIDDATLTPAERMIVAELGELRRELAVLRGDKTDATRPSPRTETAPPLVAAVHTNGNGNGNGAAPGPQPAFGPYRPIEKAAGGGLTPRQEQALREFIDRYCARTAGSKRLTDASRSHLADPRSVAGFRALWKEIVYPIVVERSAGSRLWDIDGNEYVDLANGFGTNLFGHSPAFVTRAIEEQLHRGIEIGPQSPLAGRVAAQIAEMVGHQRVAFCNTGSEAVLAAMRMARTVTGRDRIAMFAGAYHGIFDEVVARGTPAGRAVPAAPGIPASACENLLVLEYGSEGSLETLRQQSADLAAVLVEPIQSRRPELQPIKFLQDLRELTRQSGTALVFDEVVTGFRVHPGGVQALFDIRADLATYGKVVGGGLPFGVVAGDRRFMDALDGGQWQYGDASIPEVGMTFLAGTFVRHPLALAAADAVLTHLAAEGPELQRALNIRTARLVEVLNGRAAELNAPVRVTHFSSWFCFTFPADVTHAGLFFALLRDKGVHIWEGRPGFITTAHSTDDLNRIVEAFTAALVEMQAGGFLPGGRIAPVPGARLGRDAQGREAWFVPDPDRPGKYLQVEGVR
jgi:acyl transferase domain-containing protein/glutamate-1-semialdehyde aminotransferase